MATSCRRREGVPATAPPKFFKIILNPESDSLRIPAEFTRRHGQNLSKRVVLKVPDGSVMEAELIRSSNGEASLQKGWLEFKERYAIGFGYLVVFIYNGNSQFDVLIFDTTASEISYPALISEGTESHDDDDDDSVVILERFPGRKVEAETLELSSDPPATKRKRSNNDTIDLSASKTTLDRSVELEGGSTSEESSNGARAEKQRVTKETCIAYQQALAYKCAKSNTSQIPFFISLMQQTYVAERFNLNVPMSFARASFLREGTNTILLETNGRKWRVRCIVGAECRKAMVSAGWKGFVQENELKVGDACIFELSKTTKLVWSVIIFRS